MKRTIFIIGCLTALVGLIWVGQGTGYFPYPAQSLMISQMPWAYSGAALMIVGIGAIFWSFRA